MRVNPYTQDVILWAQIQLATAELPAIFALLTYFIVSRL